MSDDPFKKAADIRKGLIDNDMPMYEELTGWLQRVPVTWLPGLLASVIFQCVRRNVFKTGSLLPYCKRSEEIAAQDHPELRSEQEPTR